MTPTLRIAAMAVTAVLAVTAAHAQSAERQIRDQLRAQGFTNIAIDRDDDTIEVRADRGRQQIALAYDARTGRLEHQESSARGQERADAANARPDRAFGLSRQDGNASYRSRAGDDDDDRGNRGRGNSNASSNASGKSSASASSKGASGSDPDDDDE